MSALPRDHAELLYHASLEFNSTLDFDTLLPRLFERVIEILDAEAGSIWLVEGDNVVCHIARGQASEGIEGLELPLGAGIVGSVAGTGEAELVADASEDPRFIHQVDEQTGFETRSMVAAPLQAKEQVLGVFQLLNKRSGEGVFDREDLVLLEGLGVTAGLALRNAQLHRAEKQARDLETLLKISNEISSALDVDRLAMTVVNLGSQTFDYTRAAVGVVESGRVEIRAISGTDHINEHDEDTASMVRLIRWLAESEEIVYVTDVGDDSETARALRERFPEHLERSGVASLCLAPLRDDEGRIGALYMEAEEPGFLEERELEAVGLLANQVTISLRNAQLYEQVPLRGLIQPVADWRRRAAKTGRQDAKRALRKIAIPAAVVLALLMIPWGERIKPRESVVVPGTRTPVRAAVPGLIVRSLVEQGDEVDAGRVLAVLREDELRVEREEAVAARAIASREAADARAGGRLAEARMAELRSEELARRVEVLDEKLDRTRLRAPVGGVVLTPRPEQKVGEWLEEGETFVVLGRTDRLEVESRVEQRDIDRVHAGQKIRLRVPARPEYTFVGTVTKISAGADTTSDNPLFLVRSELTNDRDVLRPGMEAKAKIEGRLRPLGWHLVRPFKRWVQMRFWR